MARDPLQDSIYLEHGHPLGHQTAFVLHEFSTSLLSSRRKDIQLLLNDPFSPSSSVLDISLTRAIIGPKFPFHKDVTTCKKNGLPLNLRLYVCNTQMCVCIYPWLM